MFKKVMAFAAVAVLSCSVAFGAEFTVSNQFPPSHHISKAIHVFADKVVELSGGQLKVNVADSGSLYNDSQILEAVQDGLVEVGLVGTYKWGGMVPAADVFDLPFLFVDLSSPEKFLNAGAADILDAEFNKKGVKNLFWVDYGFIQMWNNEHPLHSPKDFEGLTMRSYSAGDSITLKALGAAPTLISSAEMYMAIQNGTVKGATTGMPAAVSRKIYEVCKYLTIANYSTAQFSVQANLDWWNGLDADSQKAILEAGKVAEKWLRGAVAESEGAAEKTVRDAGLEVNALTAEERAQMVAATKSVWDTYVARAGETGQKLVDLAHKVFD
ncbi:TRAP transporter substrate-binding protein DctP [Pyramidobacter sp. YE332]|uniref:TRAP transporter substrate-binding protein n=1 Tax=unclassified Pyramidobacter TaxID=2632171 RepID=UPI00098E9951|nr:MULTISPECIES: TRAP transporter substrate-binding protein DctP [unclassified Pyramidobacter]OON87784.1 C4-dicarboxylate ABC transporter substrate-binding protein [Pyramidobacter sp. C12-8]WOL41131.1 TRAP transporter substrate-binding protein DctP [Pyramidobacter sp. YE332]